MKDFTALIMQVIILMSIVFTIIFTVTYTFSSIDCKDYGHIAGVEVFYSFPSGCYVHNNGKWVTKQAHMKYAFQEESE